MKQFKESSNYSKSNKKEENKGKNRLFNIKHKTRFLYIGSIKCMLKLSFEDLTLFPKYSNYHQTLVNIIINIVSSYYFT